VGPVDYLLCSGEDFLGVQKTIMRFLPHNIISNAAGGLRGLTLPSEDVLSRIGTALSDSKSDEPEVKCRHYFRGAFPQDWNLEIV
jgi:hypothetical protein